MPVRVSVRPLGTRRLGPTRQTAFGTRERISIPDPNDAITLYQRAHPASRLTPPNTGLFLPPLSTSSEVIDDRFALGKNQALAERGQRRSAEVERQRREAFDAGRNSGVTIGAPYTPTPPSIDPGWDAFFQALYEAGATRVRTGAVAYGDAPGYFEKVGQPVERPELITELIEQAKLADAVNAEAAYNQRQRRIGRDPRTLATRRRAFERSR